VTQGLFGLTSRTNGNSSLVQIDPSTGHASGPLFSFPLSFEGAQMTYWDSGRQFVVCASPVDSPRMAFIDTRSHAVREVAITGLPSGIQEVEGIAYYAPSNTFVLTCGPAGYRQDHLVAVDTGGQVIAMSQGLPFPDADYVVFNAAKGTLWLTDFNDSTGVQAMQDPFGTSPSFTQIANSPINSHFGGSAVAPDGQLFALHDADQALYKLVSGSFAQVGAFNTTLQVSALSFGSISPFFQQSRVVGTSFSTVLKGLVPGETVTFETSTNLQSWIPVQTNIVSGFSLSFTNATDPALQIFFLRAFVR
jgi:hypothetical protein